MRKARSAGLLAAALFCAGCEDPTAPVPGGPPEIRERIVRALPGERIHLGFLGSARQWTVSDPAVASIAAAGVVDAKAPGWALVVAEGTEISDSVLLAVGIPLVEIVAGVDHACGLDAEGVAYCWGGNFYGQLGTGHSGEPAFTPMPVSGDLRFTMLVAGQEHTCGITADGEAYCWGKGTDGQLGTGAIPGRCGDSVWQICISQPQRVAASVKFQTLSAGDTHTCAVGETGDLYCWGSNRNGQLGAPSGECRFDACSPAPIRLDTEIDFKLVAAGKRFTCALAGDGAPFCWGGIYIEVPPPGEGYNLREPAPLDTDIRFDTISSGYGHVCGLTGAGEAYCWGSNDYGELGSATHDYSGLPLPLPGNSKFSALSLKYWTSCGLRDDGAVRCWGGIVDVSRTDPFEIALRSFSMGNNFFCGIGQDSVPYCWGFSAPGLGVRTARAAPTPIAPPGPLPELIGSF